MNDEQGVSRRDFVTRAATVGGAAALLLGGLIGLRGDSQAHAQVPPPDPPDPDPIDPPTPPDPPEDPESSESTESVCGPIPESAESEPEPLPGSAKPGKKKNDDKGPSCG